MLDHHIQKSIVYMLALAPSYRFSELKPDDIDNKLFNYHLKKVMAAGYVDKLTDGEYALTPLGRRVGKDAVKKDTQLIDRAYSVLFMAIRRQSDGAWLLCERKTHPLLGRIGFMHAQPESNHPATVVARDEARRKTGLDGDFTVRGSGYLRMFSDSQLESFTHFTLLACDVADSELTLSDDLADYFWRVDPDTSDAAYLPSIGPLMSKLKQPGLFYYEQSFND